ncbi:MAG: AAA family ATPase [Alphaproteobacteria bacterium]|nr:AAA family ATPase [Alphaproteobacteria bacterium]
MSPAQVRDARRICVLGCSGAGKSTLTRELSGLLGLPAVHLDKLHWAPGWVERSDAETQARIDEAVAGDRWVIDGNFSRYSARRFERADLLVWLDYPRRICMQRVLKRVWTTSGTVRPDMGEGCPERLDVEFLRWVWHWEATQRPGLLDRVQDLALPLVWLRHPVETEAWLAGLRR